MKKLLFILALGIAFTPVSFAVENGGNNYLDEAGKVPPTNPLAIGCAAMDAHEGSSQVVVHTASSTQSGSVAGSALN